MFGFLETITYWSVARVVFKPNVAPQKEMLLAGFVCAEDAQQLFENYTFIFPHWTDRLRRNCNWLEICGSSPPSHYQRSEAEKIKVTKWSNLGCAAISPFCFSTFISCFFVPFWAVAWHSSPSIPPCSLRWLPTQRRVPSESFCLLHQSCRDLTQIHELMWQKSGFLWRRDKTGHQRFNSGAARWVMTRSQSMTLMTTVIVLLITLGGQLKQISSCPSRSDVINCANYFSFVPQIFSSLLQSCPLTLANRTYVNYREVNSMAPANASCCQATCIVVHIGYLFTTWHLERTGQTYVWTVVLLFSTANCSWFLVCAL